MIMLTATNTFRLEEKMLEFSMVLLALSIL